MSETVDEDVTDDDFNSDAVFRFRNVPEYINLQQNEDIYTFVAQTLPLLVTKFCLQCRSVLYFIRKLRQRETNL